MIDVNLIIKKIYSNEISSIDLSNITLPNYASSPIITESIAVKKHEFGLRASMALISKNILVTALDKSLYFWDTDALDLINVINTKSDISKILRLPNSRLLTYHKDNILKIWYVENKISCEIISTREEEIFSMALLPNNLLVTGGLNGVIKIRHLNKMKSNVSVMQGRKSDIQFLLCQNNSHLISIDRENYLTRWYLDAMIIDSMSKLEFNTFSLSPYFDGTISLGDGGGNVYNYDYVSRKYTHAFKISDHNIDDIKVLPDTSIAAVGFHGVICILNIVRNRIGQSILLPFDTSYVTISNIEVLTDGKLVICTNDLYGIHKIISLKFPDRPLKYEDMRAIVESLNKNQSVTSINLRDKMNKEEEEATLSEIRRIRNNIKILTYDQKINTFYIKR